MYFLARPGGRLAAAFLFLCLVLQGGVLPAEACTAIAVGHSATTDGAGYTTSTADCLDCDFRIAKVPARSFSPSDQRPVFSYRAQYPHVVMRGRASTWEPSNLEGVSEQLAEWRNGTLPIGSIPELQGRPTYALLESGAGYGLVNEKMVTIAESTCIAVFVSAPVSAGGHALLDVSELSRIALERTSSARDAVRLMGALAERYGYYGAEWDQPSRFDEAGEALMVGDPDEVFVFHILPDDTGRSAVWAAQRVPDDHITAVANQFIIRNIDPADNVNFLHSRNMYAVAERNGLYRRSRDGPHLDFTKTFMKVRPHSSYSTHRVYRVFTLADPALIGVLDPYPSALMDGYPFSVKPQHPLTVNDLFRINRDHYEDSPWDMTRSLAAQPFGDPNRYDVGPVGNLSTSVVKDLGEFGRAISIGRTSYAVVSRATRSLPARVGALAYVAHQQPSSSVFVPVYVAAEDVPREMRVGSLFRFNDGALFWAVTGVSNWVHHFYKYALGDLRQVQNAYEKEFSTNDTDGQAAQLEREGRSVEAEKLMTLFSNRAARQALQLYKELFPRLIARFHDGFRMEDPNALRVQMSTLFYSPSWLDTSGFLDAAETGGGDAVTARIGHVRSRPGVPSRRIWAPTSIEDARHMRTGVSGADEWPGRGQVTGQIGGAFRRNGWGGAVFVAGLITGAMASLIATYASGAIKGTSSRTGYSPIA